jgi:hypothetical protein
MEFYLPSLFLLLLSLIVIVAVLPNLTPFFMAVIAIIALVAAVYNHYSLFGDEYRYLSWLDKAKSFAPILLIGTVVIVTIGYILLLFTSKGKGGITLPSISRGVPPPQTSSNFLTNAVGNGLQKLGFANNESKSASRNNAFSISRSLEGEVGPSTRRSIEESRWKRAV